MVSPYVVKFVSTRSNVGKTHLASSIVRLLKERGYVVGVVKHCVHGVDIEDKDSHIYLKSGADTVIASSSTVGIIYYNRWVDSLQYVLNYVYAPIVIVEGFKESTVGDSLVVAEDIEEALKTDVNRNAIAYVVKKLDSVTSKIPKNVYPLDNVEAIANLIEEKALNYIYNQLPRTNCGYCGFNSCREFAVAYAKGLVKECPAKADVKLVVNGKDVELNPFVKRIFRSMILGFISELKGVPKNIKEIEIKIE